MALGYVFLSKSEVLLENLSFQGYDAKMSRNLSAKADLTLNWETSLNADGGAFHAALDCPAAVTLSGTVAGSSLETVSTTGAVMGGKLVCSGVSGTGIPLIIEYASDYATFSTGTYVNSVNINPSGTATVFGGTFVDPEAKAMTFNLPTTYSNLDGDLNSDDFRAGSTGSVAFPSGYGDNDVDARKTAIGLVRNDSGWNSVFWNNPKSNAVIEKNPNNADAVNAKMSATSSGFLRLDVDRPYSVKVVEFDSGTYLETGELRKIATAEYASATGGIGYLQNDLTLSGTRSNGDNAKAFDFKNRNYAIFLSYPVAYANGITHLKYRISGENDSGSGLYLVPIDDSYEGSVKYLGSDVVIDKSGNYRSKTLEFSAPKTGVNLGGTCQWTWG